MNKLVQNTSAALLHEIKTSIGQSLLKAVRRDDFCSAYQIVSAVRTHLNRTNTARNNDLHEMYLITSAMRTQLNPTNLASQGNQNLSIQQRELDEIKMKDGRS